jgi:phospholipase/carboxylesterase
MPVFTAFILLLITMAGLPLTAAQPAARTHFYEIRHVMSCQVRFPADYDPARTYPLLVALHGSGGSPMNFDSLWEKHAAAQCIFAAPEGPYPFSARQGGSMGRSWYLLVKDRRIWELADPLAVQAMIATVVELKASYKVGPVYILGFSQGAALAYQAAIGHPETFAGVLAVAGVFPAESIRPADLERARDTLRIFIAHGSRDPKIHPRQSETARALLEKAGFQVSFQAFKGGHAIPPGLLRQALDWIGAASSPGGPLGQDSTD